MSVLLHSLTSVRTNPFCSACIQRAPARCSPGATKIFRRGFCAWRVHRLVQVAVSHCGRASLVFRWASGTVSRHSSAAFGQPGTWFVFFREKVCVELILHHRFQLWLVQWFSFHTLPSLLLVDCLLVPQRQPLLGHKVFSLTLWGMFG